MAATDTQATTVIVEEPDCIKEGCRRETYEDVGTKTYLVCLRHNWVVRIISRHDHSLHSQQPYPATKERIISLVKSQRVARVLDQ